MVVRPTSGPVIGQAEIEVALTEPFTYISEYTKKKIRNLEKRKAKLESYKAKLKQGEQLTKDQQIAVNKFDEVIGMLLFANDIISHITQVEVVLKKEKKKRHRRDTLKLEADKHQSLTRQIELYTLMHLTSDELVSPLREECSFLPSPGASLNQFASGTAKHLISLTDPNDKNEPVNYQQIKEKLEEIEPQFNPVPEYTVEEDYEIAEGIVEKVAEEDEEKTDAQPEIENATPEEVVEEETKESKVVEDEIEFVSDEKIEENGMELSADANDDYTDDIHESEEIEHNEKPEKGINQTIEFVNREVLYREEDHIKEILVEVSSQFNFMAPAAADDDEEDDDASEEETRLNFIHSSKEDVDPEPEMTTEEIIAQGEFINTNMQYEHQGLQQSQVENHPPLQQTHAQQQQSQHSQQHSQQQMQHSQHPHQYQQQHLHQQQNHHQQHSQPRAPDFIQDQSSMEVCHQQQQGYNYEGQERHIQRGGAHLSYDDAVKDELNWQQKQPPRQVYNRSTSNNYKNSQRYQRQFNDRSRQNGPEQSARGAPRFNGYSGRRYENRGGRQTKPE